MRIPMAMRSRVVKWMPRTDIAVERREVDRDVVRWIACSGEKAGEVCGERLWWRRGRK